MFERTSVGLDVHARSVAGCALDAQTGEIIPHRMTPDYAEILAWIVSLPAPVRVAYEAGPTGFGLARSAGRRGRCVVAAPSKLQRPAGDRIKTDARDAMHLARLLRMDEIVEVRVPTVEQEAARDLVRAREDVRGDLMRYRHRLSKLLLRQASSTPAGRPGPASTRLWLRRQHFDQRGIQLAFDADLEAMLLTLDRRDRLDKAITEMANDSEYTARGPAAGLPARDLDADRVRLAVEIGDWHRFTGSTIGAYLGLVPTEHSSGAAPVPGLDHQDRQHPRPPAAGRGRLAPPPALRAPARPCGPAGS